MRPYVGQKSDLIYVMSGAFLLSVLKFRETSKISDLLTSGDPDIKLICINCISVNKGVIRNKTSGHLLSYSIYFPSYCILHFPYLYIWRPNFDTPTNFQMRFSTIQLWIPAWLQGFSITRDIYLSRKHNGFNSPQVVQVSEI